MRRGRAAADPGAGRPLRGLQIVARQVHFVGVCAACRA